MKITRVLLISAILALSGITAARAVSATTLDYGDIILSGGEQSGHFPQVWDLTACDLTLTFTYDGNGLVDDLGSGAHAWAQLGLRQVGFPDFNPTWMTEGAGVWLSSDYDWAANTFDPDAAPALDMDDKLILQKGGGMDEGAYNLPAPPPNPWANYAVWFDRDGVDPWQALLWGAIDGVTYNTGGLYPIELALHAVSADSGEAFLTINGASQGFYDPAWYDGPPQIMPAGMTFSGDLTQMQVFYGLIGYGAQHTVAFRDLIVAGCLATLPVSIDIKPGSDPNTVNLGSNGVIPVAILSSATFNAALVDPATVSLAGAGIALRGNGNKYLFHQQDVNGDGLVDLVVQVETTNLDPGAFQDGLATLTGYATLEGVPIPIRGADALRIVPPEAP